MMKMRVDNWKTVKDVLLEALKLDASKRRRFLERADITPETRAEVESLLVLERETEDFMSLPVGEFSKDFLNHEDHTGALINQPIGIYEVVSELGVGGMGAVYLARRTDGKFEQRVAIKMLKREFNTEKIRRHFTREKEILATLAHPNIAKLLDAGTTADGIPYLVMEYVEGMAIDEFCQRRKLSLTDRLKLFNKVCEAVAAAHRNLIIHRDLKPSNILVTEDGEPKLLDFGISKLLDANAEDSYTVTHLGAMTPQYASPEQIKGEPVTTATDVYSLGVVLIKILTGSLPYRFGNLLRDITEAAPALPSEAALKGRGGEGEMGRKGEGEMGRWGDGETEPISPSIAFSPPLPFSLSPSLPFSPTPFLPFSLSELRGDLDNIILKSLRKEPERRYETIEQFSADIWRYIDGLPVLARPATFSYRARKFYGRNKVSVLAAALILVSLFAGIAVAVSQANAAKAQARIASEARAAAESETERARAEQEKSEKISRFMSKVISYANPSWYAEGGKFEGEVKLIDVMDDLGGKIDIEFALQPDIQSELHHKFAEVYNFYKTGARAEGARVKELFHAQRALELRKQFYGEHHELVAKDLFYLVGAGAVESGEVSDENYAKTLAKAINMMRETNPKNLNLPYMLSAYATRLSYPVDVKEIEQMHLQAGIPLPDVMNRQETYLRAAIPPTTEDKYQLAERYFKEALPIYRQHYKEVNYAIVLDECSLAFVLIKQNKRAEFEEHYRICKQEFVKYPPDPVNPISKLDLIKEVLAGRDR